MVELKTMQREDGESEITVETKYHVTVEQEHNLCFCKNTNLDSSMILFHLYFRFIHRMFHSAIRWIHNHGSYYWDVCTTAIRYSLYGNSLSCSKARIHLIH